jgi:hypothetical protein
MVIEWSNTNLFLYGSEIQECRNQLTSFYSYEKNTLKDISKKLQTWFNQICTWIVMYKVNREYKMAATADFSF